MTMMDSDIARAFARRLRANADHAEALKFSVANLSTMSVADCRALARWIDDTAEFLGASAPDVPELVERLTQYADGWVFGDRHFPMGYEFELIKDARDALTALQAEVVAKDAQIAGLEGEYEALADTVGKLGEDLADAKTALNKIADRGTILALRDANDAKEAAEAEIDKLKSEMERLLKADRACQWYWPENSTESENCADSPQEVVQNAYGWEEPKGEIVAVARGGVVEVTYCAALPPAPDADSDDEFWVEETSAEAAAEKITDELKRRTALTPAKGG